MVGMPRNSCFLRGAEPCISMLILLTMLIIMLILLNIMFIMLTIKLIFSIVRTACLIIPCI